MHKVGLALVLGALAVPVLANDTTAQLSTGGLVFVANDKIQMASEDLYISPAEVRVAYEFNNTSDEDQAILVAFPMPDIVGDPNSMVDIPIESAGYNDRPPIEDPDNLFGFSTTFNGKPVEAELHQYAFAHNIDYSSLLRDLGIPLEPFGDATRKALNGLDDADKAKLTALGLVFSMEYDAGEGWQADLEPTWTLRSTYSWQVTFPPGMSDVIHTYRPSVGGTVATTFMPDSDEDYVRKRFAEYQDKYCVDDTLVKTLSKKKIEKDGWTNYPYVENWISYVWSTGNNWYGPIGKFTLTVDKGSTENLISFCGENVKKTGPTTFQMTAEDWYPPWDRELEILLLVGVDWFDE